MPNGLVATAFTAVSARHTLGGHPHPPPTVETAPAPKSKLEWPKEVREYVSRAFASENHIEGITNEEISAKLKQVITNAAENGRMFHMNWSILATPQRMIQAEREAIASSIIPASSNSHPTTNMTPYVSTPRPSGYSQLSKRPHDDEEYHERNDQQDGATPPWLKKQKRNGLEDRITHSSQHDEPKLSKRQRKLQAKLGKSTSKLQADIEKRRQRFGTDNWSRRSPSSWTSSRDDTPYDTSSGPVVGTCTVLEKNYFRLTSAPKPEEVRSLDVLKKTLELLKQKWEREKNYNYICDQLKSVRQDLTVQHIKNEFTVEVYEMHARIALMKEDLGEYNQCQSQLRALYALRLGGHPVEFLAYRILYLVHTQNRIGLNDILVELTPQEKKHPAIKHALAVRSALALGDSHKLIQLYKTVPNKGRCLMELFIARERVAIMTSICKTYVPGRSFKRCRHTLTDQCSHRPRVPVGFVTKAFGFVNDESTFRFILENGGEEFLQPQGNEIVLLTNTDSFAIFDAARKNAFRSVDIKGQI